MKCLVIKVSVLLLALPIIALAGWQVAKPEAGMIPSDPFFQASASQPVSTPSAYNANAFPNQFASLGHPATLYAISVSGSVKENLERIMDRYHWKVIWKAPFDYNFDGRISGTNRDEVIQKLLSPFPLQARLYRANQVMIIVPRKM